MSGACADRLAGWRAARAARSVTSVTSAFSKVATLPEAQKSADVASVTSVAGGSVQAGDDVAARAAFYFAASERAREALATPDADLVAERAEILAAHEAEARGEYPIKPEGEHRAHIAALLLGARLRLPAWGDPSGPTGGAVAKVRK